MTTPTYPLYQWHDAPPAPNLAHMHMGLWFERYFNGYEPNFTEVSQEGKSAWLRGFTTNALGRSGELKTKAERIRQLATSQGGQTRIYQSTSPFVTGLGNPHPQENGFTWHPTLGLPYLPGSAVKGLVRAVVETAWQGEDKAGVLQRWFGTEAKGDVPEHSGCFIFLDALPTAPCALVPEVMTPHMGKWYEKGGKTPPDKTNLPGDWHSPVPVGYLTARKLQLQFAILPRANLATAQQDIDGVWQALDYGLQWLGAGAKTAQGFGLMESEQSRQSKAEEKWEGARPKFSSANGSLTVEKSGKTAIALAPAGAALLQSLSADMHQKIKSNQFVKITAYVASGVLLRVEKA